ncbi:hypothetical protein [Xanthomonas bundabergensis]|uniref:hypothetical protein n=1 Tax=Xanthomonas bundabergensis TaxID=3160842 RepID=UPI0035118B25
MASSVAQRHVQRATTRCALAPLATCPRARYAAIPSSTAAAAVMASATRGEAVMRNSAALMCTSAIVAGMRAGSAWLAHHADPDPDPEADLRIDRAVGHRAGAVQLAMPRVVDVGGAHRIFGKCVHMNHLR